MKKILKVFSYLVICFVLLVIVLTVTAKIAEDKIADLVLKKVSENIKAPVTIDKVSFNLLRKFPYANIELSDVSLGSTENKTNGDSLSISIDTIFNCKKLYISVKSKPLLSNRFEIVKVNLNEAKINYLVDTTGNTNIDFLLSSPDTSAVDTVPSKPLNLILNDLSAWDIVVNYNDESLKTKAKVKIPELKINAEIDKEKILASVVGSINLTNCSFSKTKLHLMNNTDVNFDIDYENDSVSIKYFELDTDGAKFSLLGNVILTDPIKTDIRFGGAEMDLDELIKYAPKDIMEEYGIDKVEGKIYLDATAKGLYSDSELPQVNLNIDFKDGNISTSAYPELKNISFKGKATNGILRNNRSTQADFSSLHFETEKSKFDIAFSLLDIDQPKYTINTIMEINLGEFNNFIPDTIVQNLDGVVSANLTTRGELPDSIGSDFIDYLLTNSTANIKIDNINSKVDSSLSIQNFSSHLIYTPNNLKIQDLNISVPEYNLYLTNTSLDSKFTGSVNDLSNLKVDLYKLDIQTKESRFYFKGFLENFNNPTYSLSSNIEMNLDEIKTMLPDTLINKLSGRITADIKSNGTINPDSIEEQAMGLLFENSSFNLDFEDISVEVPDDTLYTIENLSGDIDFSSELIKINKFSGKLANIYFGIDSTTIENIYNSVILNKKESLKVNTRLALGDIDYKMFAPFMISDTTTINDRMEEKEEKSSKRFTVELKGVANVKSLTYDSIYVEDISTLFNVTDSLYILDQFKFNAFNGNMNSSIRYTIKPNNKSVIETKHNIQSMDIHKLLSDFNNFEDFYKPSIKAENLNGLFSTELYSRINMIGDSVIQDDIRVIGSINLEEGGVYDFEPAANLSKFTGIKELDNIQFKTLDSKIFIFKSSIFVPETFIASNALNIGAYGMQSFGEDYEYHLEIKLSDVLFGKSKKQRRKEAKAGEDFEDNRNMRELYYSKIDGKTKYGIDNKSLQSKMKNKIILQQKILDFRFDPRLVSFDTKVYSGK